METRAGRAVLKGAPPEGPAPPGSLTWRTRGRSAFEGLRRARTVRSGPFTVSWLPAPSDQPPALAFAIGKRVGNAVVRNRLRRRLREAARQLATLPRGTYLIRARPGAVALSFQEISAHLSRAVELPADIGKAHVPTGSNAEAGNLGNGSPGNGGAMTAPTTLHPTPSVVARALRVLITVYQAARAGRSPVCRFVPSCSDYALEALEHHGARRGLALTVHRLVRCRPGGPFGLDPVPSPYPQAEEPA